MTTVGSLTAIGDITVSSRDIRIADVIQPGSMDEDLYNRVNQFTIARIPVGTQSVDLSPVELKDLLRRRVPALNEINVTGAPESYRFSMIKQKTGKAELGSCYKLRVPLQAGEILTPGNLSPISCSDQPGSKPALRFDRNSGVVTAIRDLAAHTNLGRLSLPYDHAINAGEPLIMIVQVGHVQIERPVKALQAVTTSETTFVVDANNKVHRVPVIIPDGGNGGSR